MSYKTAGTNRTSAQSTVASAIVASNNPDGSGPVISGSGITATTTIKTALTTPGQTAAQSTTVASGLTITQVLVTDSSYTVLDDTAIDSAGGYIKIIGTGFQTGCTAYLNAAALTTIFISSTEVRAVVPANIVGSYSLMVFNTTNSGAIYLNLGISNFPTITTAAGSIGSFYETTTMSASIAATGDTPLVYSLYSGSLPPGATLAADGTLSGTSALTGSNTTYSFVVKVTDPQKQDSFRSFSITINTDVVSWNSPAAGSTNILAVNTAGSLNLSAASAAGTSITYTADTLPTGMTLSGSSISGTPTVEGTTSTTLTATAATTGRSATRTISWTVALSDAYFKNVTLLLNGNTGSNITNGAQNNTFLDSSTNNFSITRAGNVAQGSFTPFSPTGWSNYFDGTTSYLTNTSSSGVANFGTGDFTWEAWLYFNSTNTTSEWEIFEAQPATGAFQVYRSAANALSYGLYGVAGTNVTPSNSIPVNQWFHLAISRTSGTASCYINGVRQVTVSDTRNFTQTGVSIGARNTGVNFMPGYISNLRIIKGTGIYSGATITVPTSALAAITNTTLLTCQSNRFIDNSTNAFALTVNGTPAVQAYSPFSSVSSYVPATHGGSAYFDGTGDYLYSSTIGTMSGDFTIDCWVYITIPPPALRIICQVGSEAAGRLYIGINSLNQIELGIYAVGTFTLTDTTVKINQWNHVAIVRSGSTTTGYINGISAGNTATALGTIGNASSTVLGATSTATNYFTGYISNFRIVNGTAVYTSAFTAPTTPVTAISNTSLLLNFTNAAIVDAHSSNNIETVGNAQLSTAVTKYGAASMAFDGTGDYLAFKTGPNQNFALGAGDWTIEMWMYPTSSAAVGIVFDIYDGNSAGRLEMQINTARTIGIYGASAALKTVTTSTVTLNTWNHVAVCKSGGSTRIFINGTQGNTTYTDTWTYTCTTGVIYIGANGTNGLNNFFGYIDDFRITKGYARYTSNFTPPVAL